MGLPYRPCSQPVHLAVTTPRAPAYYLVLTALLSMAVLVIVRRRLRFV
jgi:hypothetical protein